jgi:hypothetical protein
MNRATHNFAILGEDCFQSDFLTTRVLRFPMNTQEFMERGSVLLVTLLAIVFDDKFLTKLKSIAEDQKNLTGRRGSRDLIVNLLLPDSRWRS